MSVSSDRLKRLMCVLCSAGFTLGAAPWCAAQGTEPTAANPEKSSVGAARTARELARMASLDLQLTGGTKPRDFQVAALLLELANSIAPEDETVLRLLIDASSSAGDREMLQAETASLVRLSPADTVAQLRLISGRISSLQDSDARLAVYERFLGEQGKGFDRSILSRLALDAALLLRERGDMAGFARKLSLATELDSTNKDAASLAVSFFTERSGDHAGRLTLLINLLKADPFDPETHLAIARELVSGDAVVQAARFYESYRLVRTARGEAVEMGVVAEMNVVAWERTGAASLVRQFREQVERTRAAAEAMRKRALAQDRPLAEIPDPEKVRLSPEMERVRVAAAMAMGDEGQADYAYSEMVRTFEQEIAAAMSLESSPEGTTNEQLLERRDRMRAELMWMRIWAGRDLALAEETLAAFRQDQTIEAPETFARMEAWLMLHKGQLDEAGVRLAALAEKDVLARLGLCVLDERRGKPKEAAEGYAKLARSAAGSVIGAVARTRYEVIMGKALEWAPGAAELEALAAGVPGWLEEMIKDPRRVISLVATPEPSQLGPMDPARVRLRVRNVSPIPLAVGPERPINSRVLLVPWLEVGLQPVKSGAGSVVVRLDRRLRLLPQEEIDVMVWADQGNLGWLMNQVLMATVTVKWKVIQGFVQHEQKYYVPGPFCQATETLYLQRSPSARTMDDAASLARWVRTGGFEDIAEVVAVARITATIPADRLSNPAQEEEKRTQLAAALAERYPRLDPTARVFLATVLPLQTQAPWLAPVEAVIKADTDPGVRLVAMALRVSDGTDPRLAAASGSGNPKLAQMAALVSSRLADKTRTMSSLTGGATPVDENPENTENPKNTEAEVK